MHGSILHGFNVWDEPMSVRMSAAKQLLKAVESLHKAGIVHRGQATFFLILLFSFSPSPSLSLCV